MLGAMRRRTILSLPALLVLGACATPAIQAPLIPQAGFQGPRLEDDAFISFDGARLGLTVWPAAVLFMLLCQAAEAGPLSLPHSL